ncbi:hypothetical protein GF325_03230 [Candidatus Bathyarchaeota archaeon]|nr:hypothetical protein [Candidatus Bathyarchaeota archaeon]
MNAGQSGSGSPLICLVSAMVSTRAITDAILEIKEEHDIKFDFKIVFVNDVNAGIIKENDFRSLIYHSDALLLDIRGNNPAVEIIVDACNALEQENKEAFKQKTIISLVGGNEEIRKLTRMGNFEARKIPTGKSSELTMDEIPDITQLVKKGIRISKKIAKVGKILRVGAFKHVRNWMRAMDYWIYGHAGIPENHKNLILFLLKEYLGVKHLKVSPPEKIPPFGIFDPVQNRYFSAVDEYTRSGGWNPAHQSIGIFYYGGIYFEHTLPVVAEFMENLEGFNVLPVFSETLDNMNAIQELMFDEGECVVNAVINLQYFQINGGPFGGDNATTIELYRTMNVPQFNPIINFDMTKERYEKSNQGILPINQVIAIIMPELDGRIEMMNVGLLDDLGYAPEVNAPVREISPESSTIHLACERIKKWMALKEKRNDEKKLAFIIYDYPPGEGNLGNAGYLDVSASVTQILNALASEGYIVNDYSHELPLHDVMIQEGAVNNPDYTAMEKFGGVMLDESYYESLLSLIPTALQDEVREKWGTLPGTIMTKGKKMMLPVLQFGNIYICLQPARGDKNADPGGYHDKGLPPHYQYITFYKYIEQILDVDAMIHVGTHGTLEFLPGKECAGTVMDYNINLQGALPNIYLYHVTNTSEAAIAKRRSNAVIINHAGPVFQTAGLYQDLARLERLLDDYNITRARHQDAISEQDKVVSDILTLAKETGLQSTSIDEIEAELHRLKISTIPSGLHIFGKPYSPQDTISYMLEVLVHSAGIPVEIDSFFKSLGSTEDERREKAGSIMKSCLEGNEFHPTENGDHADSVDDERGAFFTWFTNRAAALQVDWEIPALINALEGGYIQPGFGGDPIRNPEVYPTGKNSYGFDPRLIPSTVAQERGAKIARILIEKYRQEHGTYPETVSVVLWAFETMKTGGETVGQVFEYLGVRPVKNKSIWTTELEVIPLEELTHPRINVVVTICGIFRDTFPYIMDLINQAVDLVAYRDELATENHILATRLKYEKDGLAHPAARVFGPAPGKYNTNITDIIDAGTWEKEDELARDYLLSMSYAYRENQVVVTAQRTFEENLRDIQLISQVRDSAEYQVTDLDHYYEFTGGLSKAREVLAGEKAPVFIADTSSKEVSIDRLEQAIKHGVLTRNLNPRWIKGLLAHKRHGGQKLAERLENLLGMAATAGAVDNDTWERVFHQYIENEEIKEGIIENNRFAMMDMVKTLLQAERRGYWKTSQENLDELKRLFLELENWVERTYQ